MRMCVGNVVCTHIQHAHNTFETYSLRTEGISNQILGEYFFNVVAFYVCFCCCCSTCYKLRWAVLLLKLRSLLFVGHIRWVHWALNLIKMLLTSACDDDEGDE